MVRAACLTMALVVWLGWAAAGRAQGDYLEVLTVKVDSAKRAAFDAAAKRLVEANRTNHGDTWIAMETVYGEQGTIILVSTRRNYADIDKAYGIFYAAMNKAYGVAGAAKILQDFIATTTGWRGEIRRRRWDLSANMPSDPAALMKLIGESRWMRTTTIHVRPGHVPAVEAQLRAVKEAAEKNYPGWTSLVSQSEAGQRGMVFHLSLPARTLSDYDKLPALPQMLGAEGFQKFMATAAETVESSETVINHFVPEISNPPDAVVSASPDFWIPKPPAAKPKAAPSKPEAKGKK